MSYEKKKLAGVLGNTHLGNYSYPTNNSLMEQQEHQDVYPLRMNPMQYSCTMQPPQPTHNINPADQCLSTPQSSELVDDSCMVPVPQVVMDDHLPNPSDNLTMEENYQNTNNTINPANMELPIQAEVVMEPDNEDPNNENVDIADKPRLPPQKHCFVCNTQLPQDIETAVPFFKTETTKTNKKFSAVVSKLVGRSITPRKAHSEIICRRCFNLLDRIDTLEVELRESKEEIVSMYKTTLDQYGGKTRRKRTVVSRKSPYLYKTRAASGSTMRAPKVEKQESTDILLSNNSQEGSGGEHSASDTRSQFSKDRDLEDEDDDDDDEDDEMEDQDQTGTKKDGSKKKKKNRKFKGTHLSTHQRASVINLKEIGWTFEKISKNLGFCSSTAKRVWKQYKSEGKFEKRKRSKHHRVTSPEEDEAIEVLVNSYPNKTANEVKAELGLQANVATIKRRLREIRGTKKINNPKPDKTAKPRKPKPKRPYLENHPQSIEESNQSIEFIPSHQPQFNNINMYRPSNSSFPTQFYKDVKDMPGYRVDNHSYFPRETKPMPYYNDPSIIPQMFQQFYPNPQ